MTQWREVQIRPRSVRLSANPHYEWLRATEFAYYGDAQWLPLLIELRDTSAQKFAKNVFRMQNNKADAQWWAPHLRIPPFYQSKPRSFGRPTRFISLLATRQFVQQLYDDADPTDSIARFEVGAAVPPSSTANLQGNVPPPDAYPKGRPEVVTGVIDDGIAFAHQRFLGRDGTTRIEYFWDQVEPSDVWDDWGYGREIAKRDPLAGIDKRMQDSTHGALVDEDELYRLSEHTDQTRPGHKPLARRGAHGTHVLDLAANAGNKPPQPGTRPIVAVQLPTATTADPSGGSLAPQIYNGLAYILDRAGQIATDAQTPPLPVVVNVSYGITGGPHDGSSVLETAMDDLLAASNPSDKKGKLKGPPFRVVLPAGNTHLSRCHACVSIDAGKSHELRWRVQPDDWTESYVEIWLPDRDDAGNNTNLAITVAAPDGDSTNAFIAGVAQELVIGGNVVGLAAYFPAGEVGRRALVRLTLAPTGYPDGGMPLAPAGLWRINIDNALGKGNVPDIHAWIHRDDPPVGYPRRGRQSYFDDPNYARFDNGGRAIESDAHPLTANSYVRREYTLNGIATGAHPIVIGGIRRSDWKSAQYSACGPVLPPGRGAPVADGPDAMTISDDSPSHHGMLAAGARSGSGLAMRGTSVSAPQVACWVAEELAKGRPGDRNAVAAYTQKIVPRPRYTENSRPPGAAPRPGSPRGGAGRIEFPAPRKARLERT